MSDNKNVDNRPEKDQGSKESFATNLAVTTDVSSVVSSVRNVKHSISSERQIKVERAQKCLENAALVSKRIKEQRKATAELLGRPFEDDVTDTASEMASTMSERTGYSVATDTSTTLSVQDALNIPGISESLANTLKQKELLMERIKQYKEISKRPMRKSMSVKRETADTTTALQEMKKSADNLDVAKLINTVKEKENALSIIQIKFKALETTILDLQEKINEKDQIIEAKNKATTLITDSLSKKEKDTLDLLEDTREQMTKMQSNFIAMETEWKYEKQRLLDQIGEKDEKIRSLEEANSILENSRFDISIAHAKLAEELELTKEELLKLQEQVDTMNQKSVEELSSGVTQSENKEFTEEKGTLEISNMEELTKKLELLEHINCQMRQTNKDLENQLMSLNLDQKTTLNPSTKKAPASPHPSRKGRSTASKSKSPWRGLSTDPVQQETEKPKSKNDTPKQDMLVQALNKDILEKEYLLTHKDDLISQLKFENSEKEHIINNLQAQIEASKCDTNKVDIAVCTDPESVDATHAHEIQQGEVMENIPEDVQSLKEKLASSQSQIDQLNEEIDVANKNMIKVKSSYKIKLKQLQKTIDSFSKVSDANAEIVKLNEELHQLSQKVAELEEEKGNLQLHLVDYDSGRLTDSDIYKKLVEMETLAESRLKSITLLETQKFELVQELHVLQQKNDEMEDKLADMAQLQNDHVCSEIKSVQMEEQIDELVAAKKELELVIENLKLDKEQSTKIIKAFEEEKENLIHKLENYMQENMELTDKFEKLSAEKVSSAESIEMVESLTTQEKLELEEYNRTATAKQDDNHPDTFKINEPGECNENIGELMKQIAELKDKIKLFTQEKQEVLEKMNKVCVYNEDLQETIEELRTQCSNLTNNIDDLSKEKNTLQLLNDELNNQIEALKRERIEIIKESAEIAKPAIMEESTEGVNTETSHDDKSVGDKSNNRSKSVKQLTKDILKLKGTIKEREAEIADCQMKILSLEEQQEKQKELMQSNTVLDNKVKHLTEENSQLKREIETAQKDVESEHQYKQAHDVLQQDIQKIHQEYSMAINARDTRINELENLLVEYEKQMFNYGNSLQQKDKEIAEYINQITKLNDVSQKLKSTIDLLEEEKAKDQNAELVKSLNKDIAIYQKKLAECEEKLILLEEEKAQLLSVNNGLEVKGNDLELELKRLQDALTEKQTAVKDLQTQQQKHDGELSSIMLQAKERDEEIHEIKLQLRKESIENEKLRNEVSEKVNEVEELKKQSNELKQKINIVSHDKENYNERQTILENKNRELMEKLKKLAVTLKRKTSSYNDLELDYNDKRKQLEDTNLQVQELLSKVEVIPQLQDKIKDMEKEYDNLRTEKILCDQKSRVVDQLQVENETLHKNYVNATEDISKLHTSLDKLNKELLRAREDNDSLKSQISSLNNKLVEYEIEQKNSSNLITKITSLETDLTQKQNFINELSLQLESHKEQLTQIQFGHDAKVQECNLYIESLQTEIDKYKNRLYRLEESISTMESRRHSLERKADQLDNQLQEKQKAYTDYIHQEDELVNRLAVLIDHDRVVEKQLHVIENENREMQYKVQHLNEEVLRLKNAYLDLQNNFTHMQTKAAKGEAAESELGIYHSKVYELEASLKHITNEYQTILAQKKVHIEELESEFNTQIENSFKEKKMLSENYERLSEHVTQLERKLQEYKDTNVNLNLNLQEISAENQNLIEKTNERKSTAVDYTEQYVSEINKLNAVVNMKNQLIVDFENNIKTLQINNVAKVSQLENRIAELSSNLATSGEEIDLMSTELKSMKEINEQLQILLLQKDDQIKQLTEKSKFIFEMTIPKTEGMTISSAIEQVNEQCGVDLAALESQIVLDSPVPEVDLQPKKIAQSTLVQSSNLGGARSPREVQEPVIVAKKSYDCYKKDSDIVSVDPFSSQEGWGFEGEETEDVSAGYSYINEQIENLRNENERLKNELDNTNVKLSKVLKISKELKAKNELLSNELKISKQLSDKSILDTAIESELSSNIEVLEKQLHDLNTELEREKREKESFRKQNDIFKDANDRLTEMKEKLDTEVELWKFKCNQANDKISSLQWTTESKESPVAELPTSRQSKPISEEIIKLEQENDELQSVIDELNVVNKKLTDQRDEFSNELQQLQEKIQETRKCANCESLQTQILRNEDCITSLKNDITNLNSKLKEIEESYTNVCTKYEELSKLNEENQKQYEIKTREFSTQISTLQEELSSISILKTEADKTISSLAFELEELKSELLLQTEETSNIKNASESFAMSEKMSSMELICDEMSHNLENAKQKIAHLENENLELKRNIQDYEKQTEELSTKIKHLNTENDQLLSTVAELRSSVSSAVDQRGYEIAELWKHHLAQRENEFQRIEHELRAQLSGAESKYEQLLDNVQSSSQDETNNLIAMEQLNSLQSKLQEKSEHLTSLQNKYADVIHQLDMLRSETEDEKLILENKMLVQQEEYEKAINEQTQFTDTKIVEFESTIKNLESEVSSMRNINDNLNQQLLEIKSTFEVKLQDLERQLGEKEIEIHHKSHHYNIALSQRNDEFENVRKHLIEYEKTIEDLTYEKEAELAVIRLKMHENKEQHESIQKQLEDENNSLSEDLNMKIIECTNLNKQVHDLNVVLQEHGTKSAEMQEALENQELEIVSLKDEISSMQDIMRSSSSKIDKHVTFASDTKQTEEYDKIARPYHKDLLDAVPRAELDIALYMLHQRDVRCEELTMELTQLLEERDTLQLRLSDSLRALEDLKANSKLTEGVSTSFGQDSISELPTLTIEKEQRIVDTLRAHTSRTSSLSDYDGEKPKLQAKLSELRSVKHSRDVTLRQDSEQRQLGMRLLRRDVANLPPEALEELSQAHHTLSRDSQSTSTVLLNWLRGKSTPKVVDM